ncbi:MAG: acyl-CoA dehydrogenase family protein [Actinomycetota bacterium]|nr:acyl-CoA dehydrogenase family protein [Actinomycetota bacterium]
MFAVDDELEALQATAAAVAERELRPRLRDAERAGRLDDRVLAVLDDLALAALDVDETVGGAGAGCLAKITVLEELARGDAGGLAAADPIGPTAGAIAACPDRDVASTVVTDALAHRGRAALAVIDPDERDRSGSPPLAWAPDAPPLRWLWTIAGDRLCLAAVPDDATSPLAEPALAFAASGAVELADGRAEVSATWDLRPGAGAEVRARARLWAAAVAVGVAQDAFDATIAYTTERVVFGRPVAHHQGNAFELAALATRVHGARLVVRDAAARFDRGPTTTGDEAAAAFWATQAWFDAIGTAVAVTDAGVQLLGGHGFLVDHPAEKRFREARMLGLLHGGEDAARSDLADAVLDVADPLFDGIGAADPARVTGEVAG